MSRSSLDTNVILRLVTQTPPDLHARALSLVSTAGMVFVVSDYVFVELIFALDRHYGISRAHIAEVVADIIDLPNIESHSELLQAALTHWTSHPKLSFEDCLMAEYARAENAIPLWTFDRKLANQHEVAQTPATYKG